MSRVTHYQDDKERVIDLIHQAFVSHARPPTVRDLADKTGVGVATMHSYLKRMADEELVEWSAGHHRSLKVTDQGLALLSA